MVSSIQNNWTGSLANLLCLIQNLPENFSPAGQDNLSGLDVSQLFQDRSTDQIVILVKLLTDVVAVTKLYLYPSLL